MATVWGGGSSSRPGAGAANRTEGEWGAAVATRRKFSVSSVGTGKAGTDYCAGVVWRTLPTANAHLETRHNDSCGVRWGYTGVGVHRTGSWHDDSVGKRQRGDVDHCRRALDVHRSASRIGADGPWCVTGSRSDACTPDI